MAESESLAAGRARRSNAGNLYASLVHAEAIASDPMFQEADNDEDFQDKDNAEGDEYDLDFQSTDEEADAVDGENAIQAEAREARKAARRKDHAGGARPVALKESLHSLQKRDRNHDNDEQKQPAKKSRRYTVPIPVDDATGELVDPATRKSSRNATVRSKKQLHSKLKDEQEKRAAIPKKIKPTQRALTQDELIAEALETEEINTASLNTFLSEEEERRNRNANVKHATVEGPLLRFVSRGERVKIPMVVEVELPAAPYGPGYKRPYAPSPLSVAAGSAGTARAPPIPSPSTSSYAAYNPYRPPNPSASLPNSTGSLKGASPMPPAPSYTSPYYHPSPTAKMPSPNNSASPSAPTIVTQAKNYVILDTPDATPADDYAYLFGDHVNWGTLKVLPKNHPSARKATMCPITGLAAQYVHPLAGIPFANIRAYRTIDALLKHQYVWSDQMQCYIGDEERTEGATGVPLGWDEAVAGRKAQPTS